jgi:3-hydroxy-9,10-secoandrosta-1,3,5(10)-triene-9,17-dione monooxygenase reductase component
MSLMPEALTVAAPPPSLDPAEYRKALSCFTTGVTVVTTRWQDQDWGMTCNSFSSVSLEPRLVLWSIRKAASSLPAFTQSGGFTVSVLSQAQEAVARQFATGDMAARFAGVPVQRQASERQRLTQAVAWFDCQLHQLVDAGDHHIVIGQVQDFGWRDDAQALAFWRSRFGQFESLPA